MMTHFLMNKAAWKSLDATARAIYLHMTMRYGGPGSNNGRLHYSVREAAAELRIGKSTAQRAFLALIDRGFIVVMQRGAFSLKKRHATEWRLTEYPSDLDGSFATRDYVHWPREDAEAGTSSETVRYPERNRSVPAAGPSALESTRTVPRVGP